jgi:hypothetical protein
MVVPNLLSKAQPQKFSLNIQKALFNCKPVPCLAPYQIWKTGRLKVFENKTPRRIFGPNCWLSELHIEELYDLYPSRDIKVMK